MSALPKDSSGTHSGWLTKQGGETKSWRRRWFLLEGYQLSYYKSQAGGTPLGTIPLNGCSVEPVDHLKKDNCFQIYHPIRRTFYVFADTPEERNTWMEAVRKHIPKTDSGMTEYKIVMLGAGGVGKSALTVQLVHNMFLKEYEPTIEESFVKQVTIDGITCKMCILDTAGQEEYWTITDQYIDVGNGFIIVYDITGKESYDEVQKLKDKIKLVKESDSTPTIIVGNKIDLEDDRVITTAQGRDLATRNNAIFLETSAKTRENVDVLFEELVREIRRTEGNAPVVSDPKPKCRTS